MERFGLAMWRKAVPLTTVMIQELISLMQENWNKYTANLTSPLAGIWGMNQWMGELAYLLALFLSN